jgi:hypothetical protein
VRPINIANKISCCIAHRNIFLYFASTVGKAMAVEPCPGAPARITIRLF